MNSREKDKRERKRKNHVKKRWRKRFDDQEKGGRRERKTKRKHEKTE
jgi:hypothetical protein